MNSTLSRNVARFLISSLMLLAPINGKIYAMGGSGPFEGLKESAKKSLISIETPGSNGSGVIIGNKGDVYYFLTVAHVVQGDPTKEEFYAYPATTSRKRYQIKSLAKPGPLKKYDIAIGMFTSEEKLEVALLFPLDKRKGKTELIFDETSDKADLRGHIEDWITEGRPWPVKPQQNKSTWVEWRSYNGRLYDKTWDIQGPPIVGGVSIPTKAVPLAIARLTSAEMLSKVDGNIDGYEALYAAISTVPGMSGGGVYGARVCPDLHISGKIDRLEKLGLYPGVFAIHGRSEEYASSSSRSGVSLGVPIYLLSKYLEGRAESMGIPTGKDYENRVLNYCVNHSFY